MPKQVNIFLVVGALLSAIAAILHLLIIVGGPNWYRFFGAGERFAVAAAQGRYYPALVTTGIAAVLSVWSVYALAGAGAIHRLPLLRPVLIGITAIYIVRGVAFAPAVLGTGGQLTPFVLWSSAICLGLGIVHLVGLIQRWPEL
jgi:signal transduction histidine kinase